MLLCSPDASCARRNSLYNARPMRTVVALMPASGVDASSMVRPPIWCLLTVVCESGLELIAAGLVSDEPYRKIVYDGIAVPSVFNVYRESLVVTSFSKDLSLPGERIGYAALNPEMTFRNVISRGMVISNRIGGSVGMIPDSLISEYETRNGRLVYDGGGIQPDVEAVSETLSEISAQLYTQGMLFDFATRYRNTHNEIESPELFSLSDEDYALFEAFLQEKNFEFRTASEQAFDNLVKSAKREKYYDLAEDEFSSLEKKLSHNNLKDLETFKDEIRQLLTEEIASRYYYHEGRILAQIQNDTQLEKAEEVLNTPGMVNEVLSGNQGKLAKAVN